MRGPCSKCGSIVELGLYGSCRENALIYLRKHPELWKDWKARKNYNHDEFWFTIATALKVAGIYSKNTFWRDIGVFNLVKRLRREAES